MTILVGWRTINYPYTANKNYNLVEHCGQLFNDLQIAHTRARTRCCGSQRRMEKSVERRRQIKLFKRIQIQKLQQAARVQDKSFYVTLKNKSVEQRNILIP